MIEVTYETAATSWSIKKLLESLDDKPLLGFDTETAGVYSKEERAEASQLLASNSLTPKHRTEYSMIAKNSGLSYPSLVNTTHFIFGLTSSHSVVLVTSTINQEMLVWDWVKHYKGHLIIHNALFDLKIMYHRVKAFPSSYTDTALLSKCLINNADNYKALIGLKELVGGYFPPAWSLLDVYEPENLHDPKFMLYSATDGAALMLLWEQIQQHVAEITSPKPEYEENSDSWFM